MPSEHPSRRSRSSTASAQRTACRSFRVDDDDCDWVSTRAFYDEFCAGRRISPFAYRVECQRAIRRAEAAGCSFFCDLAVEQLSTSYGAPLRVDLPAVWVAHQPPAPADTRPLARRVKIVAANPRKWKTRPRSAHTRAVLRHLARTGGQFVVPSEPARERLGRVVPIDRVHVLAWPIVSAAAPPPLAEGTPGEVVAVFPGEARPGKGLDVLLDALVDVDGITKVDLPSVVTAGARDLVNRTGDARVQMGTSWLSNEAYRQHLCAATLAVLPYGRSAASNGGISASLLDVLSVGLPAVVTEPIARVLPPDYGGAVVVAPDSPVALAEGIAKALRMIDELRASARAQGRAYVLAHHTYEQYLSAIVEVASA